MTKTRKKSRNKKGGNVFSVLQNAITDRANHTVSKIGSHIENAKSLATGKINDLKEKALKAQSDAKDQINNLKEKAIKAQSDAKDKINNLKNQTTSAISDNINNLSKNIKPHDPNAVPNANVPNANVPNANVPNVAPNTILTSPPTVHPGTPSKIAHYSPILDPAPSNAYSSSHPNKSKNVPHNSHLNHIDYPTHISYNDTHNNDVSHQNGYIKKPDMISNENLQTLKSIKGGSKDSKNKRGKTRKRKIGRGYNNLTRKAMINSYFKKLKKKIPHKTRKYVAKIQKLKPSEILNKKTRKKEYPNKFPGKSGGKKSGKKSGKRGNKTKRKK